MARLLGVIAATGMGEELARLPAATLLAPRDTAFAQLGADARAAMLAPGNRPALTAALRGLVVPRMLRADELRTQIDLAGGSLALATLAGPPVTFTRDGDMLIVTTATGARATMGTQEITTRRAVIYVLDRWLAPLPAGGGAGAGGG